MATSNVSARRRADVLVRLDDVERARLLGGVFRPGSRSVMFRFPEVAQYEDGDMFGADIEEVDEQADGVLRVHLWFWNDLARIYVTPGSKFEVRNVRTSGDGVLLPVSAGAGGEGAEFGFGDEGVEDFQ